MYNIKNDTKFVNDVAKEICDILQIELPKIIITEKDDAFMGSSTCKASVKIVIDKNGKETIEALYIRENQENKPNFIFTIAHELRHVYQHKHGKISFENYITRNNIDKLEDYNKQEQEIDAYAFANTLMLKKYRIQMNLEELKISKETLENIKTKTKEILKI